MNLDYKVQLGQDDEKAQIKSISLDDTQTQEKAKTDLGVCPFFKIAFYHPYFNVTEQDVFKRLIATLFPFKPDFYQLTTDNPDLWGPIWICATLVFLIAASGNAYGVIMQQYSESHEDFKYNFVYVPMSAALLYAYTFGTPIALVFLMKCFGSEVKLFQTICLYGYSIAILILITILCMLPFWWIQWPLVLYGFCTSLIFQLRNLSKEISTLDQQKKTIVVAIIVLIQIILYLFFKFEFFTIITKNESVIT